MSLLKLEDPAARASAETAPTPRWAPLALGFRPFYLLAALFAAVALGVWLFALSGHVRLPLPGVWWHGHEMLFGFAVAVIVGFLYTAGRNWTGLPTPTGAPLAALVALWLAGRIAMATAPALPAALIDLAFLPLAAWGLARVLVRAQSRRNYVMLAILGLLTLSNLLFHLARLELIAIDPLRAVHSALAVITLLTTIMGGRVIPMFTASALRGVRQWQRHWLDVAAIVATALALLAWLLDAGMPAVLAALVAAGLQLVRSLGWNPWATRGQPLLWVLHLAHLWLPVALVLLAATQVPAAWAEFVPAVPRSAAVHALTVGLLGGLIIGMITRTARGHTGRPLRAERLEVAAYLLVLVAALLRVLGLLLADRWALAAMHTAGSCWMLAFALYFGRYLPWLLRARADGRPG